MYYLILVFLVLNLASYWAHLNTFFVLQNVDWTYVTLNKVQ